MLVRQKGGRGTRQRQTETYRDRERDRDRDRERKGDIERGREIVDIFSPNAFLSLMMF